MPAQAARKRATYEDVLAAPEHLVAEHDETRPRRQARPLREQVPVVELIDPRARLLELLRRGFVPETKLYSDHAPLVIDVR